MALASGPGLWTYSEWVGVVTKVSCLARMCLRSVDDCEYNNNRIQICVSQAL